MHMLEWNETDIMSCLEVFPMIDELNMTHEFTVERDDLRLFICVRQYEGRVTLRLSRLGLPRPLCETTLHKCVLIRHTTPTDGTPDFLEFITGYRQVDGVLQATGVQVSIRPQISVTVLA